MQSGVRLRSPPFVLRAFAEYNAHTLPPTLVDPDGCPLDLGRKMAQDHIVAG